MHLLAINDCFRGRGSRNTMIGLAKSDIDSTQVMRGKGEPVYWLLARVE